MRIVIADDDRQIVELLAAFVTACGYEVVDMVTGGGLAVIQSCARHRPDVVLLDIVMPKYNGFTVCQQLVSRNPNVKVLLMSGVVDCEYPSVSRCGAVGYLQKPMNFEQIRDALAHAIGGIEEKPVAIQEEKPKAICHEEEAIELACEPVGLMIATATA
jgi:DNA-binding NarL/FixJ family response regulator